MKVRLLSSMLMIALQFVATTAIAQSTDRRPGTAPATGGSESLGGQLLDDLGPGVIQKSPPTEVRPAAELDPVLRFRPPTRFDDLGPDLGPGEDLGAPSGTLPLVRARQGMQQAGEILAQAGNVADARAVQQQVVAQLDELISGLCKQCQGGDSKPGEKPPQASQRSQPKAGKAGAKPGMSAIAPRDSTDAPQPPGDPRVELADREELAKQLWGHLPERSREQMIQSFTGEFLPKYELELEKYYRRLAEEPDDGPR